MIYWEAKPQRIESVSLSGNQNSVPALSLHTTETKLPKPLLVFMKSPFSWSVSGVMGLYMTVVVILLFLWTKETMSAKADAWVQHSAICIVSACPCWAPPCVPSPAWNSLWAPPGKDHLSDTVRGILLRCDKWNISSICLGGFGMNLMIYLNFSVQFKFVLS